MGTSNAYGGPKGGTPLVPSWLEPSDDSSDIGVGQPDGTPTAPPLNPPEWSPIPPAGDPERLRIPLAADHFYSLLLAYLPQVDLIGPLLYRCQKMD